MLYRVSNLPCVAVPSAFIPFPFGFQQEPIVRLLLYSYWEMDWCPLQPGKLEEKSDKVC